MVEKKPPEIMRAFENFNEAERRWLFDDRCDDYDSMRMSDVISNFWRVYYEF